MRLTLALGFFGAAAGQQAGDAKKEVHLPMPIQHCTKALGCKFEDATVVLDSNWRWTHELGCTNSSKCNCFLGNQWVNATCQGVDDCSHVRLAHFGPRPLVGFLELQRCTFPPPYPTPKRRCRADYAPRLIRHSRPLPSLPRAQKCGIDGEDAKGYKEKYGATADGQGGVNFTFITKYNTTGGNGTNVGTRLFLLESPDKYKMFQLLNKEFTFTVDGSALPCGLNGAVYFVEMDADGGKSKYPTNTAGAAYGTGYCDAQCPHDIKWIAG